MGNAIAHSACADYANSSDLHVVQSCRLKAAFMPATSRMSPSFNSRCPENSSLLILTLTLSPDAEMKYLLSRRLMRAAVFGLKNPLSLMVAMLDLPIMAILPVSTYWA